MLIRTSNHTLKFTNQEKIDLYRRLVSDYKELLQEYINLIHTKQPPLKVMLTCKHLPTLNSISHSKWKQLCYREASEIYRSLLAKKKKFTKPEIKHHSININTDLWDIKYTPDGEFDGFIRIKTPYFQEGKKRSISLKIPFRFHKQSNKFKDNGWVMNSTLRISDNFSFSFYWNKEQDEKKSEGAQIGIDCGYKKLITCSDGSIYGSELEEIYNKISRKKQGSKAFKRALIERDNLTNKAVNDFYRNHSNVKDVICEKLKFLKQNIRIYKKFNNKLQRWSYTKTLNRLELLSEVKGFNIRYINPAYTSQTCSHCGVVIKSNRKGEKYTCSVCGVEMDADVNAAVNILRRGVYSPSNIET